jgi:hypothetical protein
MTRKCMSKREGSSKDINSKPLPLLYPDFIYIAFFGPELHRVSTPLANSFVARLLPHFNSRMVFLLALAAFASVAGGAHAEV